MAAAPPKGEKQYRINVTVNIRRGKDEIEFARMETEKLHQLIASDKQADWAKTQVEKLHKMIFMPDVKNIKNELLQLLKNEDDFKSASIAAEEDSDDSTKE